MPHCVKGRHQAAAAPLLFVPSHFAASAISDPPRLTEEAALHSPPAKGGRRLSSGP